MQAPFDYKVISAKEAQENYQLDLLENWGESVVLFEGDLTLSGDLDEGFLEQIEDFDEDQPVLLFSGNLTVQGKISFMDYWPCLLVLGDVHAEALFSGDSQIYIQGDAHIKHVVYGYYNDGMLTIHGTTHTHYVICSDHAMELTAPGAIFLNAYSDYDDFFTYDYYSSDLEHVLTNKVWREDSIDISAFLECLQKKRPVLRKGMKPARQLIQEQLDTLIKQGEPPERLDLSDAKLQRFPMQLLALPSLRSLSLNNVSFGELPEEIDQLQQLEELYLSGCSLETLPESLGKIKSLRVLDLRRNPSLTLPESFGQLTNLRVLRYGPNPLSLPEQLAMLQDLEELDLDDAGGYGPNDFPEVITKLTSLKRLGLRNVALRSLPDSFLQLTALEEIQLDGGPLCYLDHVPDLSRLPRLRIIRADGRRTSSPRPQPSQKLLKSFFAAPSLEELYIDRHGESTDYNPSSGKHELIREALTAENLEGIGQAKHLKILDLSFNDLTNLPEEVFSLPLESLNLRYNKLTKKERQRIATHLPKTKIDFRNNPNDPETNEDIKRILTWMHEANTQSNRHGYLKAIEAYQKVLQELQKGTVSSEYNELYAHYRLMWLYSQLGYQWGDLASEEKEHYKVLCAEEGKRCLAYIPEGPHVWHFTDESSFHEEVMRFSCNAVAWLSYERAQSNEDLEYALRIIQKALPFAQETTYFYVHDTYIRILLALERKQEAFERVHWLLKRDAKFGDVQDIKKSAAYKTWLKKRA